MRCLTKLLATSAALSLGSSVEAQHLRLPGPPAPHVPHARPGDTFNLRAFNAPAAVPGFAPSVSAAGGGPNLAGQGRYQAPNAWNGAWQYAAPPAPGGNPYSSGYLGRGPAGPFGGYQYGQYGNGQAAATGVQGGYGGPNAWGYGMSGLQTGPNGSQFMNGGFARTPNGYTSNFGVTQVDPQGRASSRGGTMAYQNPDNWRLGTTFADPNGRSYGASAGRRDGYSTVGAQASAPGALPGTRVSGGGDVTLRGRNTVARWGGNVTDASGLVRLGGGNGTADRRGVHGVSSAGLGGVQGLQTDDVGFRGRDTTYSRESHGTIPGVGTAHQDFSVSRNGASFDTGVSVHGKSYGVGGGLRFP